jgi:hypothetical protein
MLNKFDTLLESLLQEGRKSDENKKFCLVLDIIKKNVEKMEDSHEDKLHFLSIIKKISDRPYYTPKSFKSEIARIFRNLNKDDIADGYAKIFYKFLIDQEESPFKPYTPNSEVEPVEEYEEVEEEPEDKESVDMDKFSSEKDEDDEDLEF